MKNLREIVKEKILILDGAMGTEIQKYNLTEEDFRGERFRDLPGMMKGNNDMLNITRPDVISDIYRRYLEAGADIITANTFSCQRISQADYHLENCAREMAFEGARLARIECDKFSTPDKPRFVAGDVGPTNKTCSMSPDVSNPAAREITYDELFTDVCEQVDGLIEGGADVILIETIFDTPFSTTSTFAPAFFASMAAARPAKPDPTIRTSTVSSHFCGTGAAINGAATTAAPPARAEPSRWRREI